VNSTGCIFPSRDYSAPTQLTLNPDFTMTDHTEEDLSKRPFYERAIRFLVVGTFTLLLLYVKALAAILRLGINAVKKIPSGGEKHS